MWMLNNARRINQDKENKMKKIIAEKLQGERMRESSYTTIQTRRRSVLVVTLFVTILACLSMVHALPSGPVLTYVSNTTATTPECCGGDP